MSRSLSRVILPSLLASRVWSLVLFYYGRYFIIIIWQICVADILDVDIRLNYQFCLATDPGRWERCIPSASVSIAGRLNFSHYVRNLGEIEKSTKYKSKKFSHGFAPNLLPGTLLLDPLRSKPSASAIDNV